MTCVTDFDAVNRIMLNCIIGWLTSVCPTMVVGIIAYISDGARNLYSKSSLSTLTSYMWSTCDTSV